MLPDDYENLSESVIATSIFGNNILAAITTKDYWDVVNDYKPFMHTWYVGVVMQFYLVYPLLFYVSRRCKNTQKTLLTLISSLAVISLLVYFGSTNDASRFYYLPSRFFEFAVGGILALTYKPSDERTFNAVYTFICYALLIALVAINNSIIPDSVRLVLVVALTCVLILSSSTLSNKITSNEYVAIIGAASYSIYVWHQVILAFYRYTIANHFTVYTYALYLVVVALFSWLSYKLIEQGLTKLLQSQTSKRIVNISIISVFLILNLFAGYIYLNAGVVRDIPELYVSIENRHRNMHAEYCDKARQYDRPFTSTDKLHWFVVGNSFGRDFVNVVLESNIADKVEISYTENYNNPNNNIRFSEADRVFIATLGLSEELVSNIEVLCLANGLPLDRIVIVGEKNFGESNGQVYAKRNRPDYFEQYVEVEDRDKYIEKNKFYAQLYGKRYLDLMTMVCNSEGKVRVFTPDHHFISADTRHLSRGGAIFFGEMIDWGYYME